MQSCVNKEKRERTSNEYDTMKRIHDSKLLKSAVIASLFLGFLLGLRWFWSEIFSTPEHPGVVQGTLDLRGWDFDANPSIPLDGEWTFYPLAFVDRDNEALQPASTSRFIPVPERWMKLGMNGFDGAYGYGTYKLRILIDPDPDLDLGFWIQEIAASSRVQINDDKAHEFGKVGASSDTYVPSARAYLLSYETKGIGEIDLFIQASNFDHFSRSGITRSIRIGTRDAIDREWWYSIGFQLVTFAILLLHGLYSCILFVFSRRQKEFLIFTLLLFAAGISVVTSNEIILLNWLPVNYTWMIKIRLLSYMWLSVLILMLGRIFAGRAGRSAAYRIFFGSFLAYTLFVLLADVKLVSYSYWLRIMTFYYIVPLAAFSWIIVKMILERKNDVVYLFLAIVSVLSSVIWGIVNSSNDNTSVYYPIDIIVAIIAFSAYWFKRYFRNAEENTRLNVQLKEADKLKDQFLANTSHELRTPLHGMMNMAGSILEREKLVLGERSVAEMELLVTVGRRMSHLLDDLLDVVRLQEKRIVLQKEPLSVASIASGVAAMLRFMTDGRPVRLVTDIADSLPHVLADEKRLVQILLNLLHNALKFTDVGTVTISAAPENGRVVIRVSDTGSGMDEETRRRVFLPYEQGTPGMNEDGGIGLGLSISKQLVELHGGELSVDSEPGVGSVFKFALPAVDQPLPSAARSDEANVGSREAAAALLLETPATSPASNASTTAEINAGNANILAVDDDPVNLKVLAGILSSEPYNVFTATSAREALERLALGTWDLVVADVMMPQMSGYELTVKIRERFSMSELPVLLLTARSKPEDIQAGFVAGANDYLTKPVEATELKYRIRALTALKQSVSEQLRLEAAYLQAQIHPHFLFNALNSIMALSDEDTDRMRKLGNAFTSYLRISFDFLNSGKLVELSHELELVNSYLYVEKERFEDKLNIVWEVEADVSPMLPPLTIQPLVENAVRHGVRSRAQGGTVRIRIARQDDCALIEVSDDGIGMDEGKIARLLDWANRGKGIGVANTNRRLTQLYGQGLLIHSIPGEGTTVSFLIPHPS